MFRFLTSLAVAVTLALGFAPVVQAEEVVVYSARKEHLIKPLFDAYTAKTGVEIKYITGKANALMERLRAEGKNTPADMLLTVDAGNLWSAADAGLLQSVDSEMLDAAIPANLKDPKNRWFGLSLRARTIIYNPAKVQPSELSTYEALAGPEWKGRLVLRTSKKVYNQSLVAALIEEHGRSKTEDIVEGWVANLAMVPTSNDTKALQAVAAGVGDVTIVNTYYYGRLLAKDPSFPLKVFWPNQTIKDSGVHVNVSGGGVTKHAKNPEAATKLLEWLASPEAQGLFGSMNHEYPANPSVAPSAEVAAWGEFTANPLNVAVYGKNQAKAVKLMDRAGYK